MADGWWLVATKFSFDFSCLIFDIERGAKQSLCYTSKKEGYIIIKSP